MDLRRRLDGDTFGVDGAEGGWLEAEIGLEVLSDFSDETVEGKLADQGLSGLLVATDLTESNGLKKNNLQRTTRWD